MAARKQIHRPFGSKEFAAERSHQDALVSSENARAAAQAVILINGGAATALIAFLSKDHINPYYLKYAPVALLLYAIGVICGASMVHCAGHALKFWGLAWREYMVDSKDMAASDLYNRTANTWNSRAQFSFWGAMVCFLAACMALAIVFYNAPAPPEFLPQA